MNSDFFNNSLIIIKETGDKELIQVKILVKKSEHSIDNSDK